MPNPFFLNNFVPGINLHYLNQMNRMKNYLSVLLISLLSLSAWGQQTELSIDLPDVDAAILATELMQTESMSEACMMLEELGVQLLDSCYGTAHYTYLKPNRVVRFTLTRQRNSPRLRTVSFSAPAVEQLLPKALRRLGYRLVTHQENYAEYRHSRLPIHATLEYQPVWRISSMTFRLTDDE